MQIFSYPELILIRPWNVKFPHLSKKKFTKTKKYFRETLYENTKISILFHWMPILSYKLLRKKKNSLYFLLYSNTNTEYNKYNL